MGVRPSELYGISDRFEAFCFDRAVVVFGSHVEADMDTAAEDAKNTAEAIFKRQRRLDIWLMNESKQKFRDPAVQTVKL